MSAERKLLAECREGFDRMNDTGAFDRVIKKIDALLARQGDWVMVPKEPTDEMLNAGATAYVEGVWLSPSLKINAAYRAMLSAAPKERTNG